MCLSLHIDVFCHLNIVSGAVDARKWNTKWRHILLFGFNRGAKAAEAARNICAVYGDNAIGERTARKWFSQFADNRLSLVTLHVQEDIRGLMKIV